MTGKTEQMLEKYLQGLRPKQSEKPSIPPALLHEFSKVARAIRTGKIKMVPCCPNTKCVWLADDGQKGTCFWKECLYDKRNTKKVRNNLPSHPTNTNSD